MPLNPTVLWLIAGVILCVMEITLPTAFVEFTMGISAIIVGLVALVVPQFGIQVALWLALSVIFTVLSRRFIPQTKPRSIADATEAQTITEILPGQTGRVLYEGNSWQARCEDDEMAIAPNQRVYVVERRGNTLIVMPESLLRV
ncbi:MAG: NfeD family protein [Leptolyngbyaceae cyanobacterium SL_5_9]|nr:NfeD family protein [Leptolyngbyaceae cyanobacterium SM1_4_3]NJN58267.1 NfeD family protein [Leptolyngbyaceae cyanobacterium SL_5_9]